MHLDCEIQLKINNWSKIKVKYHIPIEFNLCKLNYIKIAMTLYRQKFGVI